MVKKFAEIADEAKCSINLEHHIRKTNGSEATVDGGRGASSLVGAARSIEVLNRMTPAEGEKLGLDQSWRYFSVDDGKANMAPLGERRWFRLALMKLGNSTNPYPEGDDFDRAARQIRAGNWKENLQATDWLGSRSPRRWG